MTFIRALTVVVAAGLLALPGCAGLSGDRLVGEPEALTIAVVSATSVTVYLAPRTGTRVLLGNISPAREEIFVYGNPTVLEDYRLIAFASGGGNVVSRWFKPYGRGTVVRWDVGTNNLFARPVEDQEDDG